jgi:hypothetical protein
VAAKSARTAALPQPVVIVERVLAEQRAFVVGVEGERLVVELRGRTLLGGFDLAIGLEVQVGQRHEQVGPLVALVLRGLDRRHVVPRRSGEIQQSPTAMAAPQQLVRPTRFRLRSRTPGGDGLRATPRLQSRGAEAPRIARIGARGEAPLVGEGPRQRLATEHGTQVAQDARRQGAVEAAGVGKQALASLARLLQASVAPQGLRAQFGRRAIRGALRQQLVQSSQGLAQATLAHERQARLALLSPQLLVVLRRQLKLGHVEALRTVARTVARTMGCAEGGAGQRETRHEGAE